MLALRNDRRGDCLEPTSVRLMADPLTFLAEDHLRHRQICAFLSAIAIDPEPEFRAMALSLAFLRHEFLLHNADERAGLFPMMMERCEPDDEIGIIIDRLLCDHETAQIQARTVCRILEGALESGHPPGSHNCATLAEFAAHCQRYLILENAIILRLARVRLDDNDLVSLSRKMLLRRGLVEPDRDTSKEF